MYLLDTNVLSELRKRRTGRADVRVARWADSKPRSQVFLSVITILEIERGVTLAERSDPARGRALRTWLDDHVLTEFADQMLSVDVAIARRAAPLHVPDPVPFADALIAATALVNRLTVATRNVRYFERFDGLDVVNPWLAPAR